MKDITEPIEYEKLLKKLPPEISGFFTDNIHDIEDIFIDIEEPVRFTRQGVQHTINYQVTQHDIQKAEALIGRPRDDLRKGIDGTLHRVSYLPCGDRTNGFRIRVGKAIVESAACLYPHLSPEKGLLVIGPPNVGKTTSLRDIIRLFAETVGKRIVIVDSSWELGGDGHFAHRLVREATRMTVPSKQEQPRFLNYALTNFSPIHLFVDEIGYYGEVRIVIEAARKIAVTASVHGKELRDVYEIPELYPLLGLSPNKKKIARASFAAAIEVKGRGEFLYHANLDAAVESLIAGKVPEGISLRDT